MKIAYDGAVWVGAALLSIAIALVGLTGRANSHEGHDHGASLPPVSTTVAPRAEASSNDLELVAVARGETLTIFLDAFRTNEPLTGATIEVDTPAGLLKATATKDGSYTLAAPFIKAAGKHDLAFTIQAGDIIDVLTATLTIPEPKPAPAPAPGLFDSVISTAWADDIRERLDNRDNSLLVVGGGAFLAGVLLTLLFRRRSRPATEEPAGPAVAVERTAVPLAVVTCAAIAVWLVTVPAASAASVEGGADEAAALSARDVSQRLPDGTIFVPKATQRILAVRTLFTAVESFTITIELPARVIPDPNGAGLVQASLTGRLKAPNGGFPRLGTPVKAGDILAFVEPAIGAADLFAREQQAREIDQEMSIVDKRLKRLLKIAKLVARSEIEDAELELAGLKKRRSQLDLTTRDPEALVAPVSGDIAMVQATAGQIAEPNSVIFHIVDPDRYWVEALSYQAHAISGRAVGKLGDDRLLELAFQGSGLADRNQAIPVQFSIAGEAKGLRSGQLLSVLASTEVARDGIAVPRASVLRGSNGQSIVFEHVSAEGFVPREVRVEPLDGDRVLIVAGVAAGKRIVTQGAELLNQIR